MNAKRGKRRKPASQEPRRQEGGDFRTRVLRGLVLIVAVVGLTVPLGWGALSWFAAEDPEGRTSQDVNAPVAQGKHLEILYPFDGSVFPPEIAPPQFLWNDGTVRVDLWTLVIEFKDGQAPMRFSSDVPAWTPAADVWTEIKQRTLEVDARVTVSGVDRQSPEHVRSRDHVSIRTSRDEVGAPIFYREVNLPFAEAVKDPGAHMRNPLSPLGGVLHERRPSVQVANQIILQQGRCRRQAFRLHCQSSQLDFATNTFVLRAGAITSSPGRDRRFRLPGRSNRWSWHHLTLTDCST